MSEFTSETDSCTATCRHCDTPITAIQSAGPGEHRVAPCGCDATALVLGERLVADGGTVTACPECDSTALKTQQPQKPDGGTGGPKFRCIPCGAGFDEPVERERQAAGRPTRGLAKRLFDADPDDLRADGGVAWADLSAFQRDVIEVIATLDEPSGADVGAELRERFYPDLASSRLYENLTRLRRLGAVETDSTDDQREQTYRVADGVEALFRERARERHEVFGRRLVTDGGQAEWPVSEAVAHADYVPLDMARNIDDERVRERIAWVDGCGRAYADALETTTLVTDGGVPESFADLVATCEGCGDDVEPEFLEDGECPGCVYGTPVADGGVAWTDLHAFKRDCLEVIRLLERDGETVYGLAIKAELEDRYHDEVNHGRLYPNLDDLVDAGLVKKGELDDRTNEYALTTAAEAMLEERARRLADACELAQPVADGGDDR